MARLFVAIDLPEQVREMLGAFIWHDFASVRPVPMQQLHLTLHFIGDGAIERLAPALAQVREGSFEIRFGKLGSFGRGNRPSVLWIGVESCERLMRLHHTIGEAMRAAGFYPEARPFTPHVTVARAKEGLRRRELERFLAQEVAHIPPVYVSAFHLYSSRVVDGGHRHFREGTYALGDELRVMTDGL